MHVNRVKQITFCQFRATKHPNGLLLHREVLECLIFPSILRNNIFSASNGTFIKFDTVFGAM